MIRTDDARLTDKVYQGDLFRLPSRAKLSPREETVVFDLWVVFLKRTLTAKMVLRLERLLTGEVVTEPRKPSGRERGPAPKGPLAARERRINRMPEGSARYEARAKLVADQRAMRVA